MAYNVAEINQFFYNGAPNSNDYYVTLSEIAYDGTVAVQTGDGSGSTTDITGSTTTHGNLIAIANGTTLNALPDADNGENVKVTFLPESVDHSVERIESSRQLDDSGTPYRTVNTRFSIYQGLPVSVYEVDEYGERGSELAKYNHTVDGEINDNVIYLQDDQGYFTDADQRYSVEVVYITALEAGTLAGIDPNDHNYMQIHEQASTIEDYFRTKEEMSVVDVSSDYVKNYFGHGVRWIDTSANHEYVNNNGTWVDITTA